MCAKIFLFPNTSKKNDAFLASTSTHQALTWEFLAKSIKCLALNKMFLVKSKNFQAKSQEILAFNHSLQAFSQDDGAFNKEPAIKTKTLTKYRDFMNE